jgi:hypothetical protein
VGEILVLEEIAVILFPVLLQLPGGSHGKSRPERVTPENIYLYHFPPPCPKVIG